jgi:superfamily II DNA/RNA helicase
MDRRSGAVSAIAPSRESAHIFDFDENPWKGLHLRIISSLSKLGMERPTVIQTRAINADTKRHNLFIQSETGSGKTLAFLLPILQVSKSRETSSCKKNDLDGIALMFES